MIKDQQIAELKLENDRLHMLLARTSDHPIRAKIGFWLAGRSSGSPVEFIRAHPDVSLGVTSYHFRVLLQRGEIVATKTRPRRGATEHWYRLSRKHPFYKT